MEKELLKIEKQLEKELNADPFTWHDFSNIMLGLVISSGKCTAQERGMSIEDYIMALFDSLDKQYKLIQKLDDLIDFQKIFGSFFGGILEKVDQAALRAIVKYIVVPLLVGIFVKRQNEN